MRILAHFLEGKGLGVKLHVYLCREEIQTKFMA